MKRPFSDVRPPNTHSDEYKFRICTVTIRWLGTRLATTYGMETSITAVEGWTVELAKTIGTLGMKESELL